MMVASTSGLLVAVILLNSLFLFAPSQASTQSSHTDTLVLEKLFVALNGSRLWPQSWKYNWEEPANEHQDGVPDQVRHDACTVRRQWPGATCQFGQKRIVRITHRSGMAEGVLPEEVFGMDALEQLDFAENRIVGALPSTGWEKAAALESLDLSGNRMEGELPTGIGSLPNLRFLMLSRNRFTGEIPEAWGQLSKLEALFLDHNLLRGRIPRALSKLIHLRHIRLDYNQFSGSIPSHIFHPLNDLLALELAGNLRLSFELGCLKQRTEWEEQEFRSILASAGGDEKALHDGRKCCGRYSKLHLLTLPGNLSSVSASLLNVTVGVNQFELRRVTDVLHLSSVPIGDISAPLRFMAMGDFGTGGHHHAASRELASAHHFIKFADFIDSQFVITVGDNFYAENGQEDEFFATSFEELYTTPRLFHRKWYPTLGNHDHYASQLSFAERSPRWHMPSSRFSVTGLSVGSPHPATLSSSLSDDEKSWIMSNANFTLDIFFTDDMSSEAKIGRKNWLSLRADVNKALHLDDQPLLLHNQSAGERAPRQMEEESMMSSRYRIVVMHYPVVSSGCHRTKSTARDTNAIKGISAFFVGHDHHLEAALDHTTEDRFHFLVGGYARGPCVIGNRRKPAVSSLWMEKRIGGFSYVTVDATFLNVTFVSENGAILYKAVMPYDWGQHKVGRAPNADEIMHYVRTGRFRRMDKKKEEVLNVTAEQQVKLPSTTAQQQKEVSTGAPLSASPVPSVSSAPIPSTTEVAMPPPALSLASGTAPQVPTSSELELHSTMTNPRVTELVPIPRDVATLLPFARPDDALASTSALNPSWKEGSGSSKYAIHPTVIGVVSFLMLATVPATIWWMFR